MNNKSTYVLFGTLLALLGVIAVVQLADDEDTGEGFLLSSLNQKKVEPEKVDTLQIEYGNPVREKLVFVREGKAGWKMTEPKAMRVDRNVVDGIVRGLMSARTEKSEDLTANLSLHGLDKPTVTVTLRGGEDLSETVKLGNVTIGGSDSALVFATTSSRPDTPVAVKRSTLSSLMRPTEGSSPAPTANEAVAHVRALPDFRELSLLSFKGPSAMQEVSRIALAEGTSELVLQKDGSAEWRIEKPTGLGHADSEGGTTPVDQSITGVRPLLSNISSYSATSVNEFADDTSDLSKYGLNSGNPALIKVQVTHKPLAGETQVTETLLIGKNVDEKGDKVYAMIQGDTVVAKVNGGTPVKALRNLIQDPKSIRDKTLLRITAANVDALQMTAGETVELYRLGTPPEWTTFDSGGTAQKGNQTAVDLLLTELTKRDKITNFPPTGQNDTALGFDKPQGELKLWTEGVIKEEKKDEKAAVTKPKLKGEPTVRVVFGKTEGDVVYVRRIIGKESIDVIVPESLFGLVRRKRVEYLDPKLSTFQTASAIKLKVDRKAVDGAKAVSYETERDAKDDMTAPHGSWKILAPDTIKGRAADSLKIQTFLMELSNLKPVKLIADKPSAEALATWGLAPEAAMKATVELKEAVEGSKERTFLFGKVSDDKTSVYAKQGNSELVFTVPKFLFDRLGDGEIMDMVVYRIDRSKVKKLKLTGWADIVGTPQVREVEKKDGGWAWATPIAYPIDPIKVDTFLENVLSPRAERFITFKTGPTPEQGFDVNKGALEVEITVEGQEKPVTLTLGKDHTVQTGDAGATPLQVYYGQTNQLPGDVFVLLQDRFKAVRSIPAVFRKE